MADLIGLDADETLVGLPVTYEQAAEHFHRAAASVKSRVNRARQRIADKCGELVAWPIGAQAKSRRLQA